MSHESYGVWESEEGEEWPLGYSTIYVTTISKVNFVRIFLLNPNFLLEHRKFSSRTYAIVPQKYRELSMQVETCEQS